MVNSSKLKTSNPNQMSKRLCFQIISVSNTTETFIEFANNEAEVEETYEQKLRREEMKKKEARKQEIL